MGNKVKTRLFPELITACCLVMQLYAGEHNNGKYAPTATVDETTQKRIEELSTKIRDADSVVRQSAILSLGEIGGPQAIQTLILALTDKDDFVRKSAAKSLDTLGWNPQTDEERMICLIAKEGWDELIRIGPAAVKPLVKLLGGSDAVRSAHEALVKIGPPAVEFLIESLSDNNSYIRGCVARILGEVGDKKAAEALILALGDGDSYVRWQAADALDELGWMPKTEHEKLLYLIGKRNWSELAEMGTYAVESLINVVNQKDPLMFTDVEAATTLGEIGDKRAIQPLIKLIYEKIRWDWGEEHAAAAATALGRIGDAEVVPALVEVLEMKERRCRVEVALALGEIGDEQAIQPLIRAFADDDAGLRHYAGVALQKIGRTALPSIMEALHDPNPRVREAAAQSLGFMRDKDTTPELIQLLNDEDSDVRRVTAKALGAMGDNRAVTCLLKGLEDQDEDVRRCAALALQRIDERAYAKWRMRQNVWKFITPASGAVVALMAIGIILHKRNIAKAPRPD